MPMIELCKELGYKVEKTCHLMENRKRIRI